MNATYDRVFASPINNSKSKHLYSFGKSKRFSEDYKAPCDAYYDLKNGAMTNRSTSFGYGKKTELGVDNSVPEPGRYDSKSDFKNNKKRGFSFGSGQKSQLINEKQVRESPGPGSYSSNMDHWANLSYTMGCRTADNEEKHRNKLGPGQYNTIGMSNTGQYFYSKFKGSCCSKMPKSERWTEAKVYVPGPGTYRSGNKLDLNKEGVYFPSKYRSSGVRSFSRSLRRPLANLYGTPGPGSYTPFSYFALINKSIQI